MSRDNIAKFDPETKIWTGAVGKYPHPLDKYIGDYLWGGFEKNPDKVVQINHDDGSEWIARDLKLATVRVTQNLIKLGIKPDDVIGFNVRSSRDIFPQVLSCAFNGSISNPLHVSFTKDGIKQIFSQTKPKVVIVDFDVYETMKSALDEIGNNAKVFTVLGKIPGVAQVEELFQETGEEENFVPKKFDVTAEKKIISIICSSGTTGEPKGVTISHFYTLSYYLMITQPSPIPFRSFSFSPIYWASGIFGFVSSIINSSETRISTQHPFDIDLLVEIVEKFKPAVFTLPPSHLMPFLNSNQSNTCDFSSVRVVVSFGSIVTEDLRRKFKEKFPKIFLSTFYAMTETACTFSFYGDEFDGLSVGKIATNIQLKVVDENGNKCGYGEKGEIRIKPEYPFTGYYRNPQGTRDSLDEEGFFKSGDIGYFDENATLYVVDRIKEIFKHKGFHISPIELEAFINSIEGVEFVSVVSIPDPVDIDLPAAVIQKQKNADALTEDAVRKAVAEKFPPYKHLVGGVYFIDVLPMTPTGKIKKKTVKEFAIEKFEKAKKSRKTVER